MKKYLALLAGLAFMAACDNSTKEEPTPEPEVVPFTIEVAATPRTAKATITPADAGKPYIALFFTEDEMLNFDQENLADEILNFIQENGAKPTDLYQAGVDYIEQIAMIPESVYWCVVFGCSEDGTITTEAVSKEFTTREESEELLTDLTFDISIDEATLEPTGAIITVKPSRQDVMYCVIPGAKTSLDAYEGNAFELAKATIQYVEEQGQIDFTNIDSSESLQKGDTKVNCIGNLTGDTDQIVLCFAVNSRGEILTPKDKIITYPFKTPHPGMSDGTFTFTYGDITFNSLYDATIKASNPYEDYFCGLLDSRWKQINYPDDTAFMNWYMGQTTPQAGSSDYSFREAGTLLPDKDYDFFAYYMDAGMPVSKLFKERIHTPTFTYVSGGVSKVEMEVIRSRDGVEVGGASYDKFAFVDVVYRPSVTATEFFVAMPDPEKWDYWMSLKGDDLAKAVILAPSSTDHRWDSDRNAECMTWLWGIGQEAYFYAVAMDEDGKFGPVSTLKKTIVVFGSPALSSMLPDNSGVTELISNRIVTKSHLVGGSTK